MIAFIVCFTVCARLETVPEETPDPETTAAEPETNEPEVDLHCHEDLNDGKSTDARLMHTITYVL